MYGNAMALIGVCKAAKGQSFLWNRATTGGWERSKLGEATVDCAIVCHMNSIPKDSRIVTLGFLNTHDVRSRTSSLTMDINRHQTESKKWIKIPNFLSKFQLGWLPPTPNLPWPTGGFFGGDGARVVHLHPSWAGSRGWGVAVVLQSYHLRGASGGVGGFFGASRRRRCVLKTWNIW